jgi:serine/threonine protein kinase
MSEGVERKIFEGVAHRYVVIRALGAGGMGSIWDVYDYKSGHLKRFAIKIFDPRLAQSDARAKAHFVHEARATMALAHKNIVTVNFLDDLVDGTPLYAMELLNGESVGQMIRNRGPIPTAEALNIVIDALTGLHFAHKHGVVHQDVKPSNIMTHRPPDADWLAKLIDLGVFRAADDRDRGFAGTFAYAAPEQARGQNVGAWTDVFGAAAVLFEMLTGRRPFLDSPNTLAGLLSRSDRRPPSLLDSGPFHHKLVDVLAAALSPRPADRPQTAKEFAAELRPISRELLNPARKIDKDSFVGNPIKRGTLEDTTEPTPIDPREILERQRGTAEPLSVGGSETVEAAPPAMETSPAPTPVLQPALAEPSTTEQQVETRPERRTQLTTTPMAPPQRAAPLPISQVVTEPPSDVVAAEPNVQPIYVESVAPLVRSSSTPKPAAFRGKGATVPMIPGRRHTPPNSPEVRHERSYSALEIRLRRFYQCRVVPALPALERVTFSGSLALLLAMIASIVIRVAGGRWPWEPGHRSASAPVSVSLPAAVPSSASTPVAPAACAAPAPESPATATARPSSSTIDFDGNARSLPLAPSSSASSPRQGPPSDAPARL